MDQTESNNHQPSDNSGALSAAQEAAINLLNEANKHAKTEIPSLSAPEIKAVTDIERALITGDTKALKTLQTNGEADLGKVITFTNSIFEKVAPDFEVHLNAQENKLDSAITFQYLPYAETPETAIETYRKARQYSIPKIADNVTAVISEGVPPSLASRIHDSNRVGSIAREMGDQLASEVIKSNEKHPAGEQ